MPADTPTPPLASSSSAAAADGKDTAFNKLLLLSWYAPIIVRVFIIALSAFASAPLNGLMFFVFYFFASSLRALVPRTTDVMPKCKSSGFFLGTGADYTYSVFSIAFALAYLVYPMALVTVTTGDQAAMNYSVLALFLAYLVFDILIKKSLECAPNTDIARDTIIGLTTAVGSASLAYFVEPLKSCLFLPPSGPARCSATTASSSSSSQKFKCHMYRNGQLVA